MLVAPLLLAGCTYTPQMMARADDFNVCRLSLSTLQASVAASEIARRGLDCTPHYAAIKEDSRLSTEAALQVLSGMAVYQPPPQFDPGPAYMPPRAINCSSSRVGGSVFTNCY